jgi:hypothetical protein
MTVGFVLALSVGGAEAYAWPLDSPSDGRGGIPARGSTVHARVISDGSLRIRLRRGWHGVVVSGGVGSGVAELLVANFPLPSSDSACEALIPRLSGHQVVLRIYDYGHNPAPGVPSGARIRLGAPHPVRDRAMRSRAIAVSRTRFHGRLLAVEGIFGANHPATALLRQVRLLVGAVGR